MKDILGFLSQSSIHSWCSDKSHEVPSRTSHSKCKKYIIKDVHSTHNNWHIYIFIWNVQYVDIKLYFMLADASVPGEIPDFYGGKANSRKESINIKKY